MFGTDPIKDEFVFTAPDENERWISRLLNNDSSHRRRPVSRKPRLSKINEFLDAGLRRHDENGRINEFFNSLFSLYQGSRRSKEEGLFVTCIV
jgi:hypothetical protein